MRKGIDSLEVTTQIGCPLGCFKYCPQEVLCKAYPSHKRTLSFVDFKSIISSVPKSVEIIFSGFCEPFINKDCIKMVDFAVEQGHPISMFTTLYQASKEDVERLIQHEYIVFCLHLPDGQNTKIPLTQDYKDNVFTVIQNVKNVCFNLMNDIFISNNRENVVRKNFTQKKPVRYCTNHEITDFVFLPNGDVQLCCMDFGLWHKLGNLLLEGYDDIKQRFMSQKKQFELCSLCKFNRPWYTKYVWLIADKIKIKEKIGGWGT